jgi:hypothetical protein
LRRFSGELRNIARIDELSSFRDVSLWTANPRDLRTWFAVYFLGSKRVNLVGDNSVFDLSLVERISPVHPLLILGECPDVDPTETIVVHGVGCLLQSPPTPAFDTEYSLGKRLAFLATDGLAPPESAGRWNLGRLVHLRLTADARRISVAGALFVNLHLQPFLPPGGLERQRLVLSWGASRRAETTLDDEAYHNEWISLPVTREDWSGNWVWLMPITVDLPDAAAMPSTGQQHRDDRPLAVMFLNMSLSAEPRGRVVLPSPDRARRSR